MQAEHEDFLQERLPAYLANLGLLGDPFADTPTGHFFFGGADGEQRLDLMYHLAPYSPLLVIIGDTGVGKTALLQQFITRAKDNWRIITIKARADMGRDEFMGIINEALGLTSQSDVDPQSQYTALIAQLRALCQTAQVPILLIDDAQNLVVPLLELIHKLSSENDKDHILSVILFGTHQLQTLLNQPTVMPLAERVSHTFEMHPYSEKETAQYIRHRLRAAGASDDGPFDSITINKIHATSRGIPARINELAQQILMDRKMVINQPRARDAVRGRTGIDQRRRVITVVGVIVMILLLAGPLRSLMFKTPPLPPPESQQTLSLPMPPMNKDAEEQRVIRSDGVDVTRAPTPSSQIREETPSTTTEIVKLPSLAAPDTTAAKGPAMEELAPPIEKSRLPSAATPATQPASENIHADAGKPMTERPIKTQKNDALQSDGDAVRGAEWLKSQANSNYTLQLLAVKDENTARRFIEVHHLLNNAAYLPVKSNGHTLFAVVYGSYPSRSEAALAVKSLPVAWGTPNPWIRSFKSIHSLNP